MVQHIARRAAVAAVGLALAAGVLGVSPPAASAGTTTPSTATVAKAPTTATALPSAHACRDIGNDGKTRAVFCADVIEYQLGDDYFYTAEAEGMCQTMATPPAPQPLVQCSDIVFDFTLWSATIHAVGETTAQCGHSFGACLPVRYVVFGDDNLAVFGCDEVWTVLWGDGSNQIRLPGSGQVKILTANLGSGHISDCR